MSFLSFKPCVRFALAIFVWAVIFSPEWVIVVGTAVFLHELSHIGVCSLMGVCVYDMRAMPWGITARTPFMHRPSVQFTVSAAGPAANILLLGLCPVIERYFGEGTAELFALANLADAILNLIPALPLDGGVMLKSIICSWLGLVKGAVCMIRITAFVGAVMMIFGIHILQITGSNASYLVAGCFILCNLRHERELIMCLRKKLLTGEIVSLPPVRTISVDYSSNALCLIDLITESRTTVFRIMKDGSEVGTLEQNKLIDCVIKNTMITVGECIEK